LRELPVPDTSALASIPALHDRLVKVEATQHAQTSELQALRTRSATALSQWYQQAMLQDGKQWSEWESRLARIELLLRRKDAADRREQAAM